MLDFLTFGVRTTKKGQDVYPKFVIKKSSDLMIRGGDFYAIWSDEKQTWSTDEQDAILMIDNYIRDIRNEKYPESECSYLWDSDSGMIDHWHKYCQKQMRDNYVMLDEKLIFSNDEKKKEDYSSKRLDYPLQKGEITCYNKLMETLYSPEERHKLEWAIGSIITGDSKTIQKFMVLYGAAGTGKSTVLNIIQKLFDGYYSVFDAKALGSSSSTFALEAFKTNPLVAIQHDGDLSKIEDNTRLNSLVSHEYMTVNEKFKSTYVNKFKCFLFMGTNKPVKITDAKSGLIRRLIDVSPTGKKIPMNEYKRLIGGIDFELGAIAYHCMEVYKKDPGYYDNYIPLSMLGASNDFYNFMLDSYFVFKDEDKVTLKQAWEMYKKYCEDAKVQYPLPLRSFKEELKNYFKEYEDRSYDIDGNRLRNCYTGFLVEKFEQGNPIVNEIIKDDLIDFRKQKSLLDDMLKDCNAQYANDSGTPLVKWTEANTKLSGIDTSKLHYVKVPENHIVIDFDIPDENGNKCFEKNLQEASKWPKTYAELSKSGSGIHLHYNYVGDPKKLSRVYDEYIEIKVFTGNSSLRRKLTKCNDIPVANISSGLPLREENKVVNFDTVKSEKALRTLIKRNLNKEIHPGTKPSIDFIFKILEDAYNNGLKYDVTDMRTPVLVFAAGSTHHSEYCVKLVNKMKFKSEDPSDPKDISNAKLVFYDVEVFPNLFLVNWKIRGKNKMVERMINPTPDEIENLLKYKLIGFNCRRYDNHMLYARLMGYTNEQLFNLSKRIVNGKDSGAFFSEAYNISYTDVYDFCSNKQSLKKWEIQLGIHHQELGLPWDQPVPEEKWKLVAEYCDNDVIATEAVFEANQADFMARQIQVDLVKKLHNINNVTVNDTTNSLSTKIIFGNNRTPQSEFNYRDLSKPVNYKEYSNYRAKYGPEYKFRIFDKNGLPTYEDYKPGEEIPNGYSILPFFPGYTYELGKSIYLDQEIGEGGRVYAEPGIYTDVWDGDVASMHPHSIIFERLFGPKYTDRFEDVVKARVYIKHKDFENAGNLLDGVLKPYLKEEYAKDLAQALKLVINSIYGLTSARFSNPFRDQRNIDNIVAKRGALFMTLLKREVEKQGYKVAHIKTDSIKIPNADENIKNFIIKFGKEYGYSFETEAEFDRFCLVNDAVYVARDKEDNWTATGKQFQVPYVFKTLFSKEPIVFEDMCELKSVESALYLDFVEEAAANGEEHQYRFIGKNGNFCPMVKGANAGVLLREDKETKGKFSAAVGTTGYLWMESELVKNLGKEDLIDKSYYNKLVDEAIDTINQYGDFEWFVSNDISDVPLKSDPLPESFG